MKTVLTSIMLALTAISGAAAQSGHEPSGPYAVILEVDPTLPDYTIFRPVNLRAVKGKSPMIAFGNGGCKNIGNMFAPLLSEIASYGYVITAPGPIVESDAKPSGQSKPEQMRTAIDWSERMAKNKNSIYGGTLDTTRIAVMGQSCGGLEAIAAGADPRVDTVIVLNSGIIRGVIHNPDGTTRPPAGRLPASAADLQKLHTPVLYLGGGVKDQAYSNAERDFAEIKSIPLFNANIETGHGGTWRDPRGGVMGEAVLSWLAWQLKGNEKAGRTFIGPECGLCTDARWTVKKKNEQGFRTAQWCRQNPLRADSTQRRACRHQTTIP